METAHLMNSFQNLGQVQDKMGNMRLRKILFSRLRDLDMFNVDGNSWNTGKDGQYV